MGIDVKVDLSSNPAIALDTAIRRGLLEAGALILALSNEGAPTEPDPRHDVHMTETGFVRLAIGPDGEDIVVIGYEAFWALLQHEHLDWSHVHGGRAKFLELAVIEGQQAALEILAATIRQGMAA